MLELGDPGESGGIVSLPGVAGEDGVIDLSEPEREGQWALEKTEVLGDGDGDGDDQSTDAEPDVGVSDLDEV